MACTLITPLEMLSANSDENTLIGLREGLMMDGENLSESNSTNMVEIIHINLHNAYNAVYSIGQYIGSRSNIIASLNEPRSNNNKVYNIETFDEIISYQSEDPTKVIKAAIGVKGVDSRIIFEHLCNPNLAVAEISKNSAKIIFISAYFPPSEDINIGLDNLSNALKELRNMGKNGGILICADTNAHSNLWKDKDTDDRGTLLELFLAKEDLGIINTRGDKTFCNSRGHESVIDLMICNEKFREFRFEYCINKNYNSNSDHLLCQIFLETVDVNPEFQIGGNSTRKYIITEEGLAKLEEVMNEYSFMLEYTNFDVQDAEEAEVAANNLAEFFEEVMNHTFNKVKSRKKSNMPQNEEIKKLANLTDNKYRRWNRLKGTNIFLAQEALEEFKDAKAKLKSAIMKHKVEYWREFCSKQELNHAYKLNKIIKLSINKKPFASIRNEDGTFTKGVEETLETLLNSFYPDKNHPKMEYEEEPDPNEQVNPPVTLAELKDTISKFSNKKAPGEDGITADILKSLPEAFLEKLVIFYQSLLKIGYFPKKWKIGIVVPIPKPTTSAVRTVKDQRGITLLNLFGKIEEKLVMNRLDLFNHSNNLLNKNQFGFTRQKSTQNALHELRNFIQEGIKNRKSTAIVSFDIKQAFDNACWKKIIDTLVENRTPPYLIRCVKSFFEDRVVKMRHGKIEITKEVKQGCPQGSCSGPGLFILLFNNLFKKLDSTNELNETTIPLGFADDFNLATHYEETEEGITEMETKVNSLIETITDWGREYHLEFNPNKTKFIRISRQTMLRAPIIKLGDLTLENSVTLKHLGVVFDQEFRFHSHAKYIATKAKKAFFLIKRFSANTWGINSEIASLVYKTIVRPILTYASSIWYPALIKAESRNALRSVQHLCSTNIVKGWRTISIVASTFLSDLLPIEKYIMVIAQSELSRITGRIHPKVLNKTLFKMNPKSQYSYSLVRRIFDNKRLLEDETSLYSCQIEDYNNSSDVHIEPVISWAIVYKLDTIEKLMDEDDSYKANLHIYTDGAKPQSGAGSAFVILRNDNSELARNSFSLHPECTAYQAEMFAIYQGLLHIKNNGIRNRKIKIRSDSRGAINTLKSQMNNNFIGFFIRKLATELKRDQNCEVKTQWVDKRVDLTGGNEKADRLASEAAKLSRITGTNLEFNFRALSSVKNEMKNLAWRQWYHEIAKDETYSDRAKLNSNIRMFIPMREIRTAKFAKLCNYFTTQMITAHGNLSPYKEKVEITKNGHIRCPQCNTHDDSPEHALLYCVANRDQQTILNQHGIRYKSDFQKIVLNDRLIEMFKTVCEIILTRRNGCN